MFSPFIATGIVGILIILLCELVIRTFKIKGENARKLLHISVALYAATWAFYLSQSTIALISLILVAVVVFAQKYTFLHSFKSVKRITYGEIWFPLGIGVSAILFVNPAIYAIAVLHMGMADGLAAVVGVGMGNNAKKFRIYKQTKSIAGTLVFIATSFVIYLGYWLVFASVPVFENSITNAVAISLSSAIFVAATELVSPKGSDNILVPIVAGLFAILPTIQLII